MTVSDIVSFLDEFAPPELAEDWDNVGLLIGRRTLPVTKVLSCLTLTDDVAAEAIDEAVQLVVTHHPVLFRPVSGITSDTREGGVLLSLIEAGIAVVSPHTRFDSAAEGINQQLAESLGLQSPRCLRESEGMNGLGRGRMGKLAAETSLSAFLNHVRRACGAEYLEFVGQPEASVSVVAVACGSAAEFLTDAVQLGCDTFVTGEARFHAALEARAAGINLVLIGHYSSERPAVERLAEIIGRQFPGIESHASRVEADPLKLYSPG